MGTNPYFNGNRAHSERELLHNLVDEVVKKHGIDVFYVPRTANNIDSIFEEDTTASFNTAYKIEMYLESAQGFEGEGDFLSKFGVEIRDRVTFVVARRVFAGEITRYDKTITRPREGDLIFFPLNRKLFEIRFVEHESMFYPLGDLYTYQLQCEIFEYSNEPIDTGIPEIDRIEDLLSTDMNKHSFIMEDGAEIMLEDGQSFLQETYAPETVQDPGQDNDQIQVAADEIIDWSQQDPFSERGTY